MKVSYCGEHDGKSWLAEGLDKGSTVEDSASVTSAMIVKWGLAALEAPETPAVPPGPAESCSRPPLMPAKTEGALVERASATLP